MNVLIAGGGTGGHLFPGIALAQELRRRDAGTRILFVGTARGIETRAVPKAGFELALVPVTGLRRKGLIGFLLGLLRLPFAMLLAFNLVRRFAPQIAISVGGYAAGPAVLAARMLGIRCVVLEQNAVPGVTNRILGKLAHRVFAALPVSGFPEEKVRLLGNPVRADLLSVRDTTYEVGDRLSLLLFGGSQGARALNEAMMDAAPALASAGLPLRILHQTGEADRERVERAYSQAGVRDVEVRAFIDDMASAYRDASLVLSRAGATTIAELTVCGRPAILVPYPFAVDDHQTANARTLEKAGAAIHLSQTELNAGKIVELLEELVTARARLQRMAARAKKLGKPEAVVDIVDALENEVTHV